MAQDIQIAGATFNAVPSIVVPVAGGGSATFVDPSPTTAEAADVASGKLFFDALGVLTHGTASGGGGLVYETGTYTPTSDIAQPTISFANSHTDTPFVVIMSDGTNTDPAKSSTNHSWFYVDWYRVNGQGVPATGATNVRYGYVGWIYRGSSTTNMSASNVVLTYTSDDTRSSNTSYPRYWVTTSDFKPSSNSTSRYWRSGRTYKWIAVWAPTT